MKYIISIIVSVYNGEKFLANYFKNIEKIKSNQIEIIFINDGSTDNSLNMINEFKKNKKNIFVYSKENGGLSAARNYGILKSHGQYLFFSDCDDNLGSNFSQKLLKVIDEECDLYVFDFERLINGKKASSWINLPKNKNINLDKLDIVDFALSSKLDKTYSQSVWNKLYKKEIIVKNKIKFIEKKLLNEDLYFNLDYFKCIKNVYISHAIIYEYVIHDDSITRCKKNWLIESMENNYDLIENIKTKYNYDDVDKYVMKIILPFVITILRNESYESYKVGKLHLKNFFNSKKFQFYLKRIDKKLLTKKEFLYYIIVRYKLYNIVYIMYKIKRIFL